MIEIQDDDVEPLKVAPSPIQPSQADIEEHRLTHVPYRSWCPECVEGRGLGEQRGRHAGRTHEIPVVGIDYFYITEHGLQTRSELTFAEDNEGDKLLTDARRKGDIVKCLVIRCYESKNVFAHVVPCKGDDEDKFVANLAVEDLTWLGHVKLILKSDQEKALATLITRTVDILRFKVEDLESLSTEQSQKYDSQANGATEVGIRSVRGLFRSVKLCLQRRIGKALPAQHPLTSWLLEHTCLLLNARVRGEDGRTPWARVRGRAFGQRLIGFAEQVLWKLPTKGPQHDADGNMSARWAKGTFIGYQRGSNSYRLIDSEGVHQESRAVQRKPAQEKWDSVALEKIQVTPWSLRTVDAAVRVDLGAEVAGHPLAPAEGPSLARRLKITKHTLRDFGYTDGCRQCDHMRAFDEHKSGLQHSEACRRRITGAMALDVRGAVRLENSEARINRSLAERVRIAVEPPPGPPGTGSSTDVSAENAAPAVLEDPTFTRQSVDKRGSPYSPGTALHVPADLPTPRSLEATNVAGLRSRLRAVADEPAAEDDGDGGDVQMGFIGSINDAEVEHMIMMMGVSNGPYRRERRRATNRIVSEIYSPPRVTKAIGKGLGKGLVAVFALDLTCNDPDDDMPWDFDKLEKREKARARCRAEKPAMLIGSPCCTAWCTWQALNNLKRDPEVVRQELIRARVHLEFVCSLYAEQVEGGRLFLHEHPTSATSWQEDCMQELMKHPGVERINADQCQFGAEVQSGKFQGQPVKKPTGFLSNGSRILQALTKRCEGEDGECSRTRRGEHVLCSGKVARDAARYPPGLVKAILKGISHELHVRGVMKRGEVGLHAVNDEDLQVNHLRGPEQGYSGKFVDDMTKQVLRDDLVREARAKELTYFNDKGVWRKRPRQEAYQRTGRAPITVRWVDINKGDEENPKYRSRLVARQLKATDKSGTSYFAPTPPLESLRTVLTFASSDIGTWKTCRQSESEERTQLLILDIARAYFNAKVDDEMPTYVQLPPEDPDAGVLCAELLRHMYGTRAAADGWQEEYSSTLVAELGFTQGVSSPCVFNHAERNIVLNVHGDDFTAAGSKRQLDWFEDAMRQHYELTTQPRLGPGNGDAKEGVILNRVIRWTELGLEYEADPRQAEKLITECGLGESNTVATPGVRPSFSELENDEPLDPKLHTAFRGAAARANYLSADRMDVQFAAKEICRWMATPTQQSWLALKRLCRYLVGLPRLVYRYEWQTVEAIDVYTDTDWAGCPRTRKSTSGGCVLVGSHTAKTWSTTQSSIALSSGEAEFNGVVRGAGVGLGYQSLLRDLGQDLPLRVWTDSTASIGICSRQGLGKLRHLDTHTLWIQQAVRTGRVDLRKVLGDVNPADLFTKHSLSRERLKKLVSIFNCHFYSGRAAAAPLLRKEASGKKTISDADLAAVDEAAGAETFFPHLRYAKEELDEKYPPMVVPDEVDAGDPQVDAEDPLLVEGSRRASELTRACAHIGRRRRM